MSSFKKCLCAALVAAITWGGSCGLVNASGPQEILITEKWEEDHEAQILEQAGKILAFLRLNVIGANSSNSFNPNLIFLEKMTLQLFSPEVWQVYKDYCNNGVDLFVFCAQLVIENHYQLKANDILTLGKFSLDDTLEGCEFLTTLISDTNQMPWIAFAPEDLLLGKTDPPDATHKIRFSMLVCNVHTKKISFNGCTITYAGKNPIEAIFCDEPFDEIIH